MTTLVSDSFTRADSALSLGTADTGQVWSVLSGTWGIASNKAYEVTNPITQVAAVVDTGQANGSLSCDVFLAPASTPAITDSFTRANSASSLGNTDTGQAWTALSGTWGIISAQAYESVATPQSVATVDNSLFAWGTLTCDVTLAPSATDAGLVFRAADDNNYMLLATINVSGSPNNGLVLYTKIAGTYTAVAGPVLPLSWANGTTYTIKVVYRKGAATVYVNGVSTLTYNTATSLDANTKVGLRVNGGTDNGTRFDNFSSQGAPQGCDAGLVFRAADDNNYMLLAATNVAGSPNNGLVLYTKIAGTYTAIAGPAVPTGWVNGSTYTLRIVYNATALSVYIDAQQSAPLLTYSGTTSLDSNTRAGLRMNVGDGDGTTTYGADTGQSRFDNFIVTTLPSAGWGVGSCHTGQWSAGHIASHHKRRKSGLIVPSYCEV